MSSLAKPRIHLKYPAYLAAVCTLLLATAAQAIVNVEQAIIGRPTEGIHTTVDLLFNGANGNADKSSNKVDLLTLRQHDIHTEFLQLQYAYGKSRGQVDTDRAFAHLRHRTAFSQSWAVEAFGQVGRDPFARLTQRALLGGGLRWVLFEEDQKSAGYLGFGAFREHELLSRRAGTSDAERSLLWRANSYLVYKRQINDQVRLYSTTFYQPAFADSADFRMLEQASVLVKLAEKLDLKVSLDISFDSRPPQTVHKRDLLYSTGLEFSF
jgi:putative salt-induced outer membrane protein YdiY